MSINLDYVLIVAMTIAIVNRIKAEIKPIASLYYTLMSIAIGAGLYAVALYTNDVVKGFIFIGLAAAGIFDVYARKGILAEEKIDVTKEVK
jgi:hypothetical protein